MITSYINHRLKPIIQMGFFPPPQCLGLFPGVLQRFLFIVVKQKRKRKKNKYNNIFVFDGSSMKLD